MMKGRFVRKDIESRDQVNERIIKGFSEFKKNSTNLVFCHSGIIQSVLMNLDIHDLFLQNCGCVGIVTEASGVPKRLIGYWNNGF